MRVLVCGGRDYNNKEFVYSELDKIHKQNQITVIIQGAARGADNLAALWGYDNNTKVMSFPADWKTHGKAAGPIRNNQMLIDGEPDLVVAFPGGKGTDNMVKLTLEAKIPLMDLRK